jgi:hypothetical protein
LVERATREEGGKMKTVGEHLAVALIVVAIFAIVVIRLFWRGK